MMGAALVALLSASFIQFLIVLAIGAVAVTAWLERSR